MTKEHRKKWHFDWSRYNRYLPDGPNDLRGWVLSSALALTVIYILIGLIFAWQVYILGNISPSALKWYPFPAARVGTNIIPVSRYYRDVSAINKYVVESGTADQYKDLKVSQQVMNRLLDAAVYQRVAHRYGLVVTADEVEAAYQQSVQEEQEPVEKVLDQYYGFTPTDFKVWIAEYLLEEKVKAEVPKTRSISHILVAVDQNASEDTVNQAQQKAQSLADRINGGENFAEVAKAESNDLTSRDNGGSLGDITRGPQGSPVIDQAFEDAAFTAPLNQLVGPIRSSRGWHLIMVTGEKGKADANIADIIKAEKEGSGIDVYIPLK